MDGGNVEIRRDPRGSFEMHPSESAVIVKYRVMAVLHDVDGQIAARQSREATKLIRFENLAEATDLRRVARDAMSKCDYLPPERLHELEQILQALLNRQKQMPQIRPLSSARPLTSSSMRSSRSMAEAKLSDLSSYRMQLYNGLDEKIAGSEMILQLCQKPANLPTIFRSESLFNALVRTLFEEDTNNLDLRANLAGIFAILVSLPGAPGLFAKHRIGSNLLSEMSKELSRASQWRDELKSLKETSVGSNTTDYDKLHRRIVQLSQKQDAFLLAAVEILAVLAADTNVKIKMIKRDVIAILSRCCERNSSPELQVICLKFLLDLSVYIENLETFKTCGTVESAIKVLDQQRSPDICNAALKLLFNLSLYPPLKSHLLKRHITRRIVGCLDKSETMENATRLLYSVTLENKGIRDACSPDLLRALASALDRMGVSSPEYMLASLLNILKERVAVEEIGKRINVPVLLEKAVDEQNGLLLKVIGACIPQTRHADREFVQKTLNRLMRMIAEEGLDDFRTAALITLTRIFESADISWESVSTDVQIDLLVISKCQEAQGNEAATLAIIVFIGSLAGQGSAVPLLLEVDLTTWLCGKLVRTKEDDEELVLQIGYALVNLSANEQAKKKILEFPDITRILSQKALAHSALTRALYEELLLRLSMSSEDVHEAWKMERFQQYNGKWLVALENKNDNIVDDFEEDDEMDLVTRYGLDGITDEYSDQEDMEDIIERISSRAQSRIGYR